MKVLTIVGARPQFIKAAPVSKVLREAGHIEYLVHTGQHYDHNMSQIFFDELQIPAPDINLNIGSGSHGKQTGKMLAGIEEVILEQKPDWVLVYGDTNSTLAGALAAVKLHVLVAHVEAGLRSFNKKMPEEHNRVLTDHCADLLFCPTQTAADNLAQEGIVDDVHVVGDTMYDALLQFSEIAKHASTILADLRVQARQYLLATIHRPYNTDIPENLRSILDALREIDEPIVFLAHPRTRKKIEELGWEFQTGKQRGQMMMIEPVGYLDMLMLEQNARLILTDSGGLQKEAYMLSVPCITLRPETEWIETVHAGWNVLVSTDRNRIVEAIHHFAPSHEQSLLFGDGQASERIVHLLSADVLWIRKS